MIRSKVLSGLGVGVVAFAFAACGGSSTDNNGGSGGTPTDTASAAVTIAVQADPTNAGKYTPNPASAKVGDTVKWTFDDDASPHTVTNDDGSADTFDSGQKSKGDTFTHKFDKAGTFAYHCTLHAAMKGTITVS